MSQNSFRSGQRNDTTESRQRTIGHPNAVVPSTTAEGVKLQASAVASGCMKQPRGQARAILVENGVEFDERDAALLRAIHRAGSVAAASRTLDRSRSRALNRITRLEEAFGHLVERERGGSHGGGSRLTDQGRELLDKFDRIASAVAATARVPETVFRGTVTTVSGELATVATDLGPIRGLHDELDAGDVAQVRIGADAITLTTPGEDADPNATSARNRLAGRVARIGPGETVHRIDIGVDGEHVAALVTAESIDRLQLQVEAQVIMSWKATATRLVAAAREIHPDDPVATSR